MSLACERLVKARSAPFGISTRQVADRLRAVARSARATRFAGSSRTIDSAISPACQTLRLLRVACPGPGFREAPEDLLCGRRLSAANADNRCCWDSAPPVVAESPPRCDRTAPPG